VFGAAIGRQGPGLTPAGVVKLVAAFVAVTAVALVILWMHQTQQAERDRQAKEKQMELLRQRESQAPAGGSPDAMAAVATPIALPDEGTSAGCPLGAKRNHAEGHDFCIDAYEFPGGHIMPRTGVGWAEAEKLCESRQERLCTHREWVASCVGPNNASYPYGNTHDGTRCNVDGQPQTAGSFPHCKSPVGTFDMVGNVSEWTAEKLIAGGSALRHDARTRCDTSQKIDPNLGYSDVGFRCCTDAK
jgi:formylglycine-generating enzyme required for sulfatase activity